MNVEQALAYAREWVELHGSHTPGFCGAHLVGGILALPKNAHFPSYKDVDITLVLNNLSELEEEVTQEISYKGLILEYSLLSSERYRSPELVLSDPELADNLAADSILSDTCGLLTPLQAAVAREHAKRRWVQARCDYEKNLVTESLEGLSHALSPYNPGEALFQILSAILYLSGLLAVAHLTPPTYRRSFVLLKNLLEEHRRGELHEEALSIAGFAHLTRQQVESCLHDCAAAFDRALEIKERPFPFDYKYHPYVRPYIIEGSQEMIEEGYHREAMFWITGFLMFSTQAIQLYAPETEKPLFQEKLDGLFQSLGLTASDELLARYQRLKGLIESIFQIANKVVEQLPE